MRKTILLLVVAFPLMAWPQQAERDSVKRMSLGERLLKPLKWVGKNWSDYDPRYSVPSFYNWAAHLQNTTTQEWLTMESPEGMDVKMRSQMSNRLGPYFGYNWLFYGVTVDLNSLGKSQHRKNEFTLSVNSNLMNIDLIRRRTGGDFDIKPTTAATPTRRLSAMVPCNCAPWGRPSWGLAIPTRRWRATCRVFLRTMLQS